MPTTRDPRHEEATEAASWAKAPTFPKLTDEQRNFLVLQAAIARIKRFDGDAK